MDFDRARRDMVRTQIMARNMRDSRVLNAMERVPRHLFVPREQIHRAYDDCALPIGQGQTISQPYMVAVMTELLRLKGNEKVLEIGTGSGYQTAILAELAGEVYSIERLPLLTEFARRNLEKAGYTNVNLRTSDGSMGWPEEAPFDRIIITAAAPDFPPPLLEQLAEGGTGVAPVGVRQGQLLVRITKEGGNIRESRYTPCIFVPLVGEYGWDEERNL